MKKRLLLVLILLLIFTPSLIYAKEYEAAKVINGYYDAGTRYYRPGDVFTYPSNLTYKNTLYTQAQFASNGVNGNRTDMRTFQETQSINLSRLFVVDNKLYTVNDRINIEQRLFSTTKNVTQDYKVTLPSMEYTKEYINSLTTTNIVRVNIPDVNIDDYNYIYEAANNKSITLYKNLHSDTENSYSTQSSVTINSTTTNYSTLTEAELAQLKARVNEINSVKYLVSNTSSTVMDIVGYLLIPVFENRTVVNYHNIEELQNENPLLYDEEDGTIELKTIEKEGYIFKGWYLDAEFTQPITEITTDMDTGEINLYALFEEEAEDQAHAQVNSNDSDSEEKTSTIKTNPFTFSTYTIILVVSLIMVIVLSTLIFIRHKKNN